MQRQLTKFNIKATPVFFANYDAYNQGFPIIVNEGASRSSKSYSLMQLMIFICYNNPGKRVSVVSHSLPHCKRGVYRDFRVIMDSWNLWNEEQWRATDFVYYFPNGSYLEIFGLDDETRARGPGRDILWCNEANLIRKPAFDQLAMRTTGTIFADLNPSDFNCYWYGIADDPRNKRIHSTYKQNLPNLSQQQINILEGYKELPDPFMYNVFTLGLRGAAKELIYTSWKMYGEEPEGGDVFYGLDFGYTNPCALVKIRHYDGVNYIEEKLYQSGLTVNDLVLRVKDIIPDHAPIYADAAEPKSIEELYRAGFNVHPADKDVWAGIVKVKGYPMLIQANSKNLINELQSYKWKKDKNDEILEEPVKAHDHLCDSFRYAIHTHLTKPTWSVFSV
jgi:phage terminase large subunit